MSWEKKSTGRHIAKLEEQIRGAMEALTKRVMVLESRMDAETRSMKHELDKLAARVNGFIEGIGFEKRRQKGEGSGRTNPGEY